MRKIHIFTLVVFLVGCFTGALSLRAWQKTKPFILTMPVESSSEIQTKLLISSGLPIDIVMLGDSITEGAPWSLILPCRSVVNSGLSGDTSEGVMDRLGDIIRLKPRAVFLMIGANDIGFRTRTEKTAENILVISNRLPINGAEEIVTALNRQIETTVGQLVRKISLPIDQQDFNDGLHLNTSGYLKWRDAIHRPVMENCSPIAAPG
jgi:lysophospholipase L1-like esterase